MKPQALIPALLCCSLLLTGGWTGIVHGAEVPKGARPNLYDGTLDGTKQVSEALALARKGRKHVLLQFGANWCGWCHRLHKLFETDKGIAEKLRGDFVVVLVDVNEGNNKAVDAKYGQPTRFGLPAIAILDAEGKLLTTKDTAELEEGDHHSPEKVMAFLKQWAPKK